MQCSSHVSADAPPTLPLKIFLLRLLICSLSLGEGVIYGSHLQSSTELTLSDQLSLSVLINIACTKKLP